MHLLYLISSTFYPIFYAQIYFLFLFLFLLFFSFFWGERGANSQLC